MDLAASVLPGLHAAVRTPAGGKRHLSASPAGFVLQVLRPGSSLARTLADVGESSHAPRTDGVADGTSHHPFRASRAAFDASLVATWAGSVWQGPPLDDVNPLEAWPDYLARAVQEDDLAALSRVDADVVAAVVTPGRAVLVRTLTSTLPLFFALRGTRFAWSTNFMDLVEDPLGDLDPDLLAFLAWGGDLVPYRGIQFVSPGEVVTVTRSGIRRRVFERCPRMDGAHRMCLGDWAEAAQARIRRSVAVRAKHFRRIGLLLSGGIDSSSVAWALAEAGADVRCYTDGSPSYPVADESGYAHLVADHLGLPITVLDVGPHRLKGSPFIDPAWHFSVPYNHGLYRWWHDKVAIASGEVDCLMSGRFGDDFGGPWHQNVLLELAAAGPRTALAFLREALSLPMRTRPLLKTLVPGRRAARRALCALLPAYAAACRRRDSLRWADGALPNWRRIDHYTDAGQQAVLRLLGTSQGWDLIHCVALDVDLIGPAGLVDVAPLLDRGVMEVSRSIPSYYRFLPYGGQWINKPVLRAAALGKLPPAVVSRNYRRTFEAILQEYCLNNREFLCGMLGPDSRLAGCGVIDPYRVRAVMSDSRKILQSNPTIIRNVMVELWLRSVADGSGTHANA